MNKLSKINWLGLLYIIIGGAILYDMFWNNPFLSVFDENFNWFFSILILIIFIVSIWLLFSNVYQKLENNKTVGRLVIFSILIVLIASLYWWFQADRWETIVTSDDGWYKYPELSRIEVRDFYNLTFKKIVLFGGWVYATVFLLLYTKKLK